MFPSQKSTQAQTIPLTQVLHAWTLNQTNIKKNMLWNISFDLCPMHVSLSEKHASTNRHPDTHKA